MLQLPTDVEIKIADTIGKCNQYGLEILNYLKISFSGYLAVGFDSENPVSFIPNHPQPHVCVLQIFCADKKCYIFQIRKAKKLPESLINILTSHLIYKMGVNIEGHDARKLEKAYPDELCGRLNGFIELNRLVKAAELPVFENAQKKKPVKEKMSSLATLVEVYLQQDLPKPENERLGDWAVETLSYEQVQYAATDAYACYALFCEIRRRFAQSKGLSSWGTSTAEFQFFDLLQKQVSVIAPYNYAKLWELYSTATARTATGAQALSTSEAEMYRKFSCSTPDELHRAVFKAILVLEEQMHPPLAAQPPLSVGGSQQSDRKPSAKAIIASVVANFWEFILKLAEQDLVELEARGKLVLLYNMWLEAAKVEVQPGVDHILQAMIRDNKLVVHRDYYILLTNSARLEHRMLAQNEADKTCAADSLQDNKNDVVISEVSFDEVVEVGEIVAKDIQVFNKSTSVFRQVDAITVSLAPAKVIRVFPRISGPNNQSSSEKSNARPPFRLNPLSQLDCTIQCIPPAPGVTRAMLTFHFDGFTIGRYFTIRCGDVELLETLKPSQPYLKKNGNDLRKSNNLMGADDEVDIVRGERPRRAGSTATEYQGVRDYPIPKDVKSMSALGKTVERAKTLRSTLRFDTYKAVYEFLLWAEETQMQIDIRAFNMENVALTVGTTSRELLALKVPGLAEKRPSILVGDSVMVQKLNSTGARSTVYQGYVHAIKDLSVELKFDSSLHLQFSPSQRFNVQFTFSRKIMKVQHQGLASIEKCGPLLANWLFPSQRPLTLGDSMIRATAINPINRNLNKYQLLAVKNIVEGRGRQIPYIVFGPPGTGKTVTIVEAILQVGKLRPSSKILICAPSNTAANVLLQRLSFALSTTELFRYVSYCRGEEDFNSLTANSNLLDYCAYNREQKVFTFPGLEKFSKFKYVIATCAMAAQLQNYKLTPGHFDVVFVDEAGYAWETEIVSCLAWNIRFNNSKKTDPQLILAGDPEQLGPIVRSSAALAGGLGISFLERLLKTESVYGKGADEFNPAVITMLRDCYRCHPAILQQPNAMFYENKLISSAEKEVAYNLVNYRNLLNKSFPLIFHGVQGRDCREGSSPSWFNADEASVVISYVANLLEDSNIFVRGEEIGIITPYQKQVSKIKTALEIAGGKRGKKNGRGADYTNVQVGSCEQFQGKECRVIIISTVRSGMEHLKSDENFNLGFVKNPKRLNVAVTRAKALLIIVGNPHVLQRDVCWRKMLQFCVDNKAYTGCTWPLSGEINALDDGDQDGSYDLVDDFGQMSMIEAVEAQAEWRDREDA